MVYDGAAFFCQLGPDQMPVVGAEVLASHGSTCRAFNGEAVLNRNRATLLDISSSPGTGERLRNTKRTSKLGLGTAILSEVICQLHGAIISAALTLVNSATLRHELSFALSN